MQKCLGGEWDRLLLAEFEKPYFRQLEQFVDARYEQTVCYPPKDKIFEAFRLCPFDRLKVVLLGQDPYHEPGQAMGLSFSVPMGMKFPPSLRNIFKEVIDDTGGAPPFGGDLTGWATQGVLLLNATLTVEKGKAGAHFKHGWEVFTDEVISLISHRKEHIVFILWGNYAREKRALTDCSRHLVLESPHPSPLSAYHGFFGNHHFTITNEYLRQNGIEPICWLE